VYLFASGIWIAKIDLDNLRLLTEVTYPVVPVEDSDAWNAKRKGVGFEGPYVLKHGKKYYMFYSTWARGYEVGIAAADHVDGEWTMYPDPMYGAMDQNWCREYGGIYEEGYYIAQDKCGQCGHNCAFEGPDGGIWIAAHAYDVGVKGFMDVKFVMDRLSFDEKRGILAVDTNSGQKINGPTWGVSTVCWEKEEAKAAALYAIDVRGYAYKDGDYQLPGKVDIRLHNSFRVCAPVVWEGTVDLTACGEQVVCGTAVYEGKQYAVKAYVQVTGKEN